MRRNALLIIITLLCVCARAERTEVHVAEPGSLSTILTQEQKDTCTQLVVKGKLNSADIRLLRQMGGYTEDGGRAGVLQMLDLKDASFVTDKEPFMILDAKETYLTGTSLPGRVKKRFEHTEPLTDNGHYLEYAKSPVKQTSIYRRSSLISSSDLTGEVISYYKPKYLLVNKKNKSIYTTTKLIVGSDIPRNGGNETLDAKIYKNKGQYKFALEFTDSLWKEMKRKKLIRFAGHKIIQQEGKFILSANAHKKHFFHDTFYDCPMLQTVILPYGTNVDHTIIDLTSNTRHLQSSPTRIEIEYLTNDWKNSERTYYTTLYATKLKKKRIHNPLLTEGICNEIDKLEELDNSHDYKFRVIITISRQGGEKKEMYFADEHHLKDAYSNTFYEMSDSLLQKLREIGICKRVILTEK